MTVAMNGIAHIQLTVSKPELSIPFWEELCHFLEMRTLIRGDDVLYCIGSRTGILVRGAPTEKRDQVFDQDRAGLHHLCFRAREREDVDSVFAFVEETLAGRHDFEIVHAPEAGDQFAPRLLLGPVRRPGRHSHRDQPRARQGSLRRGRAAGAREGQGAADQYGSDGLTDSES